MRNKYIVWTENNDNEGETWSWYIPATEENLDVVNIIEPLLDKQEAELGESPYSVEIREYSEEQLQAILELPDRNGYMAAHTKVNKFEKWPDEDTPLNELDEYFYKGQMFEAEDPTPLDHRTGAGC